MCGMWMWHLWLWVLHETEREGQLNEKEQCGEGQLANANNLIEIVLQASLLFGTQNNYRIQIAICWVTRRFQIFFITFRRRCVGFAAGDVCILSGCSQHVLVGVCSLLDGHWSSRGRQHKNVNISLLSSNIFLVFAGSLLASVLPLLAGLFRRSTPLWSYCIYRSFFHWWWCQSL